MDNRTSGWSKIFFHLAFRTIVLTIHLYFYQMLYWIRTWLTRVLRIWMTIGVTSKNEIKSTLILCLLQNIHLYWEHYDFYLKFSSVIWFLSVNTLYSFIINFKNVDDSKMLTIQTIEIVYVAPTSKIANNASKYCKKYCK